MTKTPETRRSATASAIQHVVIIVKENHTFDNYFGTLPNVDGMVMPQSPNPPPRDPDHRHSAWLTRKTTAVKQQFVESDIPAYFAYARRYTLCDKYFTEVAGPSAPNHLMLIAANSPFIDNPRSGDPSRIATSLPTNLEKNGLTWGEYGGYYFQYVNGLRSSRKFSSDQFKIDASAGNLPYVSWLYAPARFDEHPPDPGRGPMGNVTVGMQWTVDQINAIVQGGLWPSTAIFVTWDDWGGWWDHVDPPNFETWTLPSPQPSYQGTQFRLGSRVGCLVLSPFAKQGYVSKVQHSHVSLVRFCETIFGLPALNQRDSNSDSMSDCFNFNQAAAPAPPAKP